MLTAMPGPSGKGNVMVGHRTVCRDVFHAWYCKQLCNHHRGQMLIPIHQQKRSSTRRVRAVPRWQETVEWQACMTQGRMSSGT